MKKSLYGAYPSGSCQGGAEGVLALRRFEKGVDVP
jgi:hypothetical protein